MHHLKTRSLEKLATLSKIVIALLVHYAQIINALEISEASLLLHEFCTAIARIQ